MLPANPKIGMLLLLGLASAACQDLPTGSTIPDDLPHDLRGGHPATPGDAAASGSRYSCLISDRTPDGPQRYHYRHVRGIRLPRSVESPDGRTTLLRLTFQSPGEPVRAQVNCRIPATHEAIDLMVATFVRPAAQPALSPARGSRGARYGEVSLFVDPKRRVQRLATASIAAPGGGPHLDTGCVTAGSCSIPGVTAYGYPSPTYVDPYSGCYWGCGYNASVGDSGGGDYYDPGSPPEDGPQPCNTGDPVIDDPRMAEEMKALWAASNYSPTTPQNQRLEQYAWVVYSNGVYSFPSMGVTPGPCGFLGSAQLTPPPGTIGFIHTHPWTSAEIQTTCGGNPQPYWNLPSTYDVQASASLGLPGYIIDANKVTKFNASNGMTPINSIDTQNNRCGY